MNLDQEKVQRFRQALARARQRYEKAVAKIAREIEAEVEGTKTRKNQKKSDCDTAKKVRPHRRQSKPRRD